MSDGCGEGERAAGEGGVSPYVVLDWERQRWEGMEFTEDHYYVDTARNSNGVAISAEIQRWSG